MNAQEKTYLNNISSNNAAEPPPLCLPHWGRGTAPAVDRVLSYIVRLEMHFPALFHPASTLSGSLRSPPSPRGEGCVRWYSFSTYVRIRPDNARKAAFSYRSLPHRGRGTAPAVDRVLPYIARLRRSPSLFFIPLLPYPPLRGTFPLRGRLRYENTAILTSSA